MAFEIGTGYHALPALYEPNDFISEKRFGGSLKGKVVRITRPQFLPETY